jgi:putative copper export protein
MGHTTVHAARWALAPLLIAHVFIVAFWFGALAPLYLASQRESPQTAARLVSAFSVLAIWLVPIIFVAGLALALMLVPRLGVLLEPYGELLMAKVIGFAALMLLAAANKWRFGPAMERGESRAVRSFRRAVVIEGFLIIGVLAATATMTSFFSPEH